MGTARLLRKALDAVRERVGAVDADRGLMLAMAAAIEGAATRYALDPGETWEPGMPLKLLLAGYTGSRNTGADVRVEEMIRQFRHVFGDDHVALSVLTNDPALTRGYFRTVEQLPLPKFFPPFLVREVHRHHGVIACEGSMFKSKFANALSTMMVGALGLAAAENKLAVAYGGEAGAMDPALEALVARYCRSTRVLARNDHSVEVLSALGIRAERGTDTAWTYVPPAGVGRRVLERLGWDGTTPILAVCPINAFWWPVRPDVARAAAHALTGAHARDHYAAFYFHRGGPDVARRQDAYVQGLADGVRRFLATREAFVVAVGMEQLDRSACEALRDRLPDAALLVSDDHDMAEMVGAIREATWMVSSRYHAIVTTMSAGVLSVGVTMDERIPNLMADRGHPDLALRVDDPDLAAHVATALERVDRHREAVREGLFASAVRHLETQGWMGARLLQLVRERYPAFPVREGLGDPTTPWAHLPPLDPSLRDLVARYGGPR